MTDTYSQGCNQLIERNGAAPVTSAENLLLQLGWATDKSKPVQRDLFPDLTEDEKRVVEALQSSEALPLSVLIPQCNMPVAQLTGILMQLELKGVVKALVGGTYRLLK